VLGKAPDTDGDILVARSSELPNYVVNPLMRQSSKQLRAVAAWAQKLANAKENINSDANELGSDSEKIVDIEKRDNGPTVVVKKVPCGKDNCSSCPHGPYRYRVTRDGDSVLWKYRGTADGGEV
jgi:hypothetical protein